MLVLSRKEGEKITAGPVTITVVKIRCGSVRIGVEAPEDHVILRKELGNNQEEETETEPTSVTKDQA